MGKFKRGKIEEELDVIVPDIFVLFMEHVNSEGLDLKKYKICHNAKSLVKTNEKIRLELGGQAPEWKHHYLSFGIGYGCGNIYFIEANDCEADEIKLWAHDPAGIEEVDAANVFFKSLLKEISSDFEGPEEFGIQGIAE